MFARPDMEDFVSNSLENYNNNIVQYSDYIARYRIQSNIRRH